MAVSEFHAEIDRLFGIVDAVLPRDRDSLQAIVGCEERWLAPGEALTIVRRIYQYAAKDVVAFAHEVEAGERAEDPMVLDAWSGAGPRELRERIARAINHALMHRHGLPAGDWCWYEWVRVMSDVTAITTARREELDALLARRQEAEDAAVERHGLEGVDALSQLLDERVRQDPAVLAIQAEIDAIYGRN